MSAIPVAGRRLSRWKRFEAAASGGVWGDRASRIVRALAADLRSVPRYLVRYSVVVLALFGALSLWDARGDGRISRLIPLMDPAKDPCRISSPACATMGATDSQRWLGLAPTLAILDDVNPQAAAWIRERHDSHALVFSDQYGFGRDKRGSLARYDHIGRTLVIQRALFEEMDGEVAAILCHEYRHSRQNVAKVVKGALSFVVAAGGDPSILENDAIVYEHEARAAIFRR